MPQILYHMPASPPSRVALLAAKTVGVDVEIKIVDLFAKDQLKPEFLKINPQHTVPTLDDNGFILWESRAIAGYLANQYGKNDTLYPKDAKKKALIDQRLYFDSGVIFPRLRAICFPILFLGAQSVPEDEKAKLYEALDILEKFLEGHNWVAGNNLTIADLSCITSVSSIVAMGFDISGTPNVCAWVKRCEQGIPAYKEANQEGADAFGKAVKSKLPSDYVISK